MREIQGISCKSFVRVRENNMWAYYEIPRGEKIIWFPSRSDSIDKQYTALFVPNAFGNYYGEPLKSCSIEGNLI